MRLIEVFIEKNIELPYKGILENFFRSIAESALVYTGTDNVSVNIILTDNSFIKSLNLEYRGKDSPTDVISFAYRDEPFPVADGSIEELGDIYISLEKAAAQADEYEVTLEDELKRLIIHGMLHILGYDHEKSPGEDERMSSLEEKIFTFIKI
jgi:probable rRNA maturation factor